MVVVDVVAQETFLLEIGDPWLHHLVEDVVAPLDLLLEGDPCLLEEIGLDVASSQLSLDVEVNADELSLSGTELIKNIRNRRDSSYKSGGVVIPGSFCVTKSLEQRIGLDDLILQGYLGVLLLALPRADHGEVGDDLLGVLRLSCTRLAAKKSHIINL